MSHETPIKMATAATPGKADDALRQEVAGAMQEALTADKERLFTVIQSGREEVLAAALRNPLLDHQH
ncbi:MAG: hypothetical protein PHR66_03705, partial [Desulfuromonadaceae bacterium]|nr:hypothetical protein [Desulfuromonadaceae bacterium]